MTAADEIAVLTQRIADLEDRLNGYTVNGLDTLIQQRGFTFGAQKVRVDQAGIQAATAGAQNPFLFVVDRLLPGTATDIYNAIVSGSTDGTVMYAQNSGSAAAQFTIATDSHVGNGATNILSLQANATNNTSQSELSALYNGKRAKLDVIVDGNRTDGAVVVDPALVLNPRTTNPAGLSFLAGGMWYRSDGTPAIYADIAGSAVTLVTSDTTLDTLTQYALLAGRSGGQTLKGDTASGGGLTLQGTAHATPGPVNIVSGVRLLGVTSDPAWLADGGIAYRSDLNAFRLRINGATSNLYGARAGARISMVASDSNADVFDVHGSLNSSGFMPHKHAADGADNFYEYSAMIPLNDAAASASDWSLKIMWSSTAASNNVFIAALVRGMKSGDTADSNYLTSSAAAVAAPAVANTIQVTSYTLSGIPAQSSYLAALIEMQRNNAGDTNTGQVSIWAVWLEYRSDN